MFKIQKQFGQNHSQEEEDTIKNKLEESSSQSESESPQNKPQKRKYTKKLTKKIKKFQKNKKSKEVDKNSSQDQNAYQNIIQQQKQQNDPYQSILQKIQQSETIQKKSDHSVIEDDQQIIQQKNKSSSEIDKQFEKNQKIQEKSLKNSEKTQKSKQIDTKITENQIENGHFLQGDMLIFHLKLLFFLKKFTIQVIYYITDQNQHIPQKIIRIFPDLFSKSIMVELEWRKRQKSQQTPRNTELSLKEITKYNQDLALQILKDNIKWVKASTQQYKEDYT